MATITLFQSITLDGVMQGPGRPDEDPRGGFAHGGWAATVNAMGAADAEAMAFVGEEMARSTGMLLGRRTYEDLLHHWTTTDPDHMFARALVDGRKYVVSRSATTELAYPNSTLLVGEAATTVAALGEGSDDALTILGSGELTRALHAAGLIDRYVLQVYPIVLGSGTRLFGPADRVDLRLGRTIPTSAGVLITVYTRTNEENR